MDNLWSQREVYEEEMARKPKNGPDSKYFEWLKSVTTERIIIKELLENWHMFCGDNYYREYQDTFQEVLEEMIS